MPYKDYPGGLKNGEVWEPFRRAKDVVERYAQDPQEPGAELSLIRHDPELKVLEIELSHLTLPAACGRFASRACPRMESMGHEATQAGCNYWDYPRMAEFAPGVELYPEWQRFDCHKYYPLFQAHLVGAELAMILGCELKIIAPLADPKLLAVYASFSSAPHSFSTVR